MTMDSSVDGKFEFLCNQILRTDSEFWEIRNKAVLGLTSLTLQYEGADTAKIQEIFNPNVFRMLKDPVKAVISDLRSQQIRDICMFLIKVSEITKDHMKSFLREAFNFILDGIKVPNRVMSGFVDNAILTMIKNTTFKSCIPSLLSEIQFSKAKLVREKCLVSPLSQNYALS
jgi:CLASP N terminal